MEGRRGLHSLSALHLWRRPALPHDGGLQSLGTDLADANGLAPEVSQPMCCKTMT